MAVPVPAVGKVPFVRAACIASVQQICLVKDGNSSTELHIGKGPLSTQRASSEAGGVSMAAAVGSFRSWRNYRHLRGAVVQQSEILLSRFLHCTREVARDEFRDSPGCRHPGHVCSR